MEDTKEKNSIDIFFVRRSKTVTTLNCTSSLTTDVNYMSTIASRYKSIFKKHDISRGDVM